METKTVAQSRVSISQLMSIQDANNLGNVHGGVIMKMVDVAGAIAAMRHAQNAVVTVALDSMIFKKPIRIGDLVTINAELTYVGRTSMETRVEVVAQHPFHGEESHTNWAYVVYVALNKEGKPCEVPPLLLETEIERERWTQAEQRQAFRKAQQAQERATRRVE
jgi:uncharacterized protein (TIGR00369 family)